MKSLKRNHFTFKHALSTEEVLKFDQNLDEFFNLNIIDTESKINTKAQGAYAGIDSRALLTSYLDYFEIFKRIPKSEVLIDLGAGYCRGTFLSKSLGMCRCVSVEFIKERARYAFECFGPDLVYICDLKTISLPQSRYFYLYFPKGDVMNHLLRQIIHRSHHISIDLFVCESHGDVLDYIDSLGGERIEEFKMSLPRHYENMVRYRFNKVSPPRHWRENLALFMLFHQDEYLIVEYFHPLLQDRFDWYLPIKQCEFIIYQGSPALVTSSGRIVLISKDERILKCVNTSPVNNFPYGKKILVNKSGKVLIE